MWVVQIRRPIHKRSLSQAEVRADLNKSDKARTCAGCYASLGFLSWKQQCS
jgi:hypothetical protein